MEEMVITTPESMASTDWETSDGFVLISHPDLPQLVEDEEPGEYEGLID